MAIWFDATELTTWNARQLTGIQRTTVSLLTPLMLLRRDLFLFKYDVTNRTFVRVEPGDFSYAVRQAMSLNIERLPEQQCEGEHQDRNAAAEMIAALHVTDRPPQKKKKKQKKTRALDRLMREAPADVKEALLQHRKAFRVLRKTTLAWVKAKYISKWRKRSMVPAPYGAAQRAYPIDEHPIQDVLFCKDDVVISLSPSWAFPNFAEDIFLAKRVAQFRFIVMIYDLIPTLFPQWVDEDITRVITTWVRRQILNADVILAISKFQKMVIGDYIASDNLEPRQIEVVRLGDDPVKVRSGVAHLPLPRYVPERSFVVCTCTIDIRKNHRCLYEVWRRLTEEFGLDHPMLILIGIPHLYVKELQNLIRRDPLVSSHIDILSDVNDIELAWYLENCLFTIYPSQYEGWGLPVGESLRAGRYCIASNSSSIPEIGGDLVEYFDPIDYLGCYRLVKRAIEDKDYVAEREKLIREKYQGARWADTAREVDEILTQLAAKSEKQAGAPALVALESLSNEDLPQALPKVASARPTIRSVHSK